MSQPFTTLTAVAAPLPLENVDTDLIWPAGPTISLHRGQQARNAFATLRYYDSGADRSDFVLNKRPWNNAKILVSGRNFGCGSSREMAVWALHEWGFRCIIAPSFGEIFYNNACLNGLLPITLANETTTSILATIADPAHCVMTIDLLTQRVRGADLDVRFEINARRRECLLLGLDDTAFILHRSQIIATFLEQYREAYPWALGVNDQTDRNHVKD